ncbi:MAG: pyridoxamine 5'-phosphate oxidase family protein, partial [Stackebrandtia sp.]
QQSRPPTPKELAQTGVLALRLNEVSVKIREGGPGDEPEDLDLAYWAGQVPLKTVAVAAIPDNGITTPVPDNLPQD